MRWPWFTIVLAAVLALSPLGQDVFQAAFLSGEALSRGIWGPIYLAGVGFLVAFAVIECYVRAWLAKQRARKAAARTEM